MVHCAVDFFYDAVSERGSVIQYRTQTPILTIAACLLLGTIGCASRKIAVTAPSPQAPQENPFLETIDNVKRSIVPVVCARQGAGEWLVDSIEGTAFFIDADGTFMTPDHVLQGIVASNRKRPCQIATIYVPDGGWKSTATRFNIKFLKFDVGKCKRDGRVDIATCVPIGDVVTLTGSTPVPVAFQGGIPRDGTEVAFSGFPLSSPWPLTVRATLSSLQEVHKGILITAYVDRPSWPGASGSPLYTLEGKVIGMMVAQGKGDITGLGVARTEAAIRQFLADHTEGTQKQ